MVPPIVTPAVAAAAWSIVADNIVARNENRAAPHNGVAMANAICALSYDLDLPAHEVFGFVEGFVNSR